MSPPAARRRAEEPDEHLATAAAGGDREAMELLLGRHQERVYRLCRRMCGNEADALDATQEALITIARRVDRFDGRSAFSTWAYRVATNACLDELRRRRRRPVTGSEEDVALLPGGHRPLGGAHGDEDPAASVAERSAIDEALAELRPEFRAPVVLRDVMGLDYAEIAAVLDIAPGTVRSRIARGRGHLARLLGGNQEPVSERLNPRPPQDLDRPPAGPTGRPR